MSDIASALRRRAPMDDVTFDQVFPSAHRFRSWLHWTPLEVALRACALLAPTPGTKVLDVGSGVGKLCLVGAATSSSSWFGVERDAEMVRVAATAAKRLQVDHSTHFVHGDITAVDWSEFHAFYLFNPFAEVLSSGPGDALTRRQRYIDSIEFVQHQLTRAAPATRVVTYHGLGGDMPPEFDLIHSEAAREDHLCLWVRRSGHS